MLERRRMDPGKRTFDELVQERQWELSEILRLRAELGRHRVPGPQEPGLSGRRALNEAGYVPHIPQAQRRPRLPGDLHCRRIFVTSRNYAATDARVVALSI
jgi:hypothetical protein